MPLFTYTITCGRERRTVQLRKSNPQGWLLQAVSETFPEVASRLAGDILRLKLVAVEGPNKTWQATLPDQSDTLTVRVTQAIR